MTVFPNLRAEMARSGVSVADIAQACGSSKSSVYRWMNGGSGGFSWRHCRDIGKLFPDCSLEYLFDTEEVIANGPDSDNPAGG